MGSSFLPGDTPTDQSVPPGSDFYDAPAPNWQDIGAAFAEGQKRVNSQSGDLLDKILAWLKDAVVVILAAAIGLLLKLAAWLVDIYASATDADAPALDDLARRSLAHVLGLSYLGTTVRKTASSIDSTTAAATLGKQITQALVSAVAVTVDGQITPSEQPGQAFLGTIARIGIEGWLEGVMPQIIGGERGQCIMELTPIMADVLGLGRLSRRVLASPIKVLIEDPYTYKLNQTYRPTLLSEGIALKQMVRDPQNAAKWRTELQLRGYSEDRIAALVNDARRFLSLEDVVYLIENTNWDLARGIQYLQDQGWSADDAQTQLTLAQQKIANTYVRETMVVWGDAYVRGDVDVSQFTDALAASGLSEFEQNLFAHKYETLRTLKTTHLSIGEIGTAIKQGILTIDDLRAAMTRAGYPEDEQTALELLTLAEIKSKSD